MDQLTGPVAEGAIELDETVEFATFMRDRPVACRWRHGQLTGDPDLLARLSRMSLPENWTRHPSTVARMISAAVAHPVTIRLLSDHDAEVDLTDGRGPDEARCDADVLGDYWLG